MASEAPFVGNGLDDNAPGRGWGPFSTLTPFLSPEFQSLSWNRSQAGPSGLSYPAGGIPRGHAVNYEMPSNTFVSQQYYARAWNNSAETKLVEGQLVFIHREYMPIRVNRTVFNVNTICTIAHVNMIMRQAWDYFVANNTQPVRPGEMPPAAVRLLQLLRMHGEHEVQSYERAARLERSVEANMPDTQLQRNEQGEIMRDRDGNPITLRDPKPTGYSVVSDTLKELCDFHRDRKLRYVISPIYIKDNWNFGGAVRAGADTTTGGSVQRLNETDRVVAVTLTVARRAEIHDIFPGGCDDGALCWFILKRIRTKDGYGPFQYVPYASVMHDSPPLDELMYRDLAGNLVLGTAIYLGRITLVEKEDSKSTKANAETASGMRFTSDLEAHRRATASLGLVTIQLHD